MDPTFVAEISEMAAAIARRDAEARAACKRPPPVPVSACRQRLEGLHRRFVQWTYDTLETVVRTADIELQRTGWRMQQVRAPKTRQLKLDAPSPGNIVDYTELVLARGCRHLLTVALRGDGIVTAAYHDPAGTTTVLHPEVPVVALDAGYAKAVVVKLGARALSPQVG